MASKHSSKKITVPVPTDKARSLWLAGLGAVSIARKRGNEAFVGLIGEGKEFQARADKLTREISADTKAQITGALAPVRVAIEQNTQKVGQTVQHVVAGVLSRLGIPTKADIDELTRRVTALSRQLKTAK
ncbi:MAG TPA: phasin family protein [Rudaea sp.]|nr:phasin family protein [Rudaea sp.]